MNQDCLKLTTYFAEHDRASRRFLADALLDCYERHQLATSVLLRSAAAWIQRGSLPPRTSQPGPAERVP